MHYLAFLKNISLFLSVQEQQVFCFITLLLGPYLDYRYLLNEPLPQRLAFVPDCMLT